MDLSAASESALVAQAKRGSKEAAGELFSRHWPAAWRAALGITGRGAMADDIAQDAFERAFAALSRFDERRPFGPWLHRIVVNRALDLLRSERRLVGLDDAVEEALATWDTDGSGDRDMLRAVAVLSVERRAVVILRYGLGYPPSEIADILGLPTGTVHSRLARALEDLRNGVEGGCRGSV
jgi:RNA polymerase sigma-70 factor, ECF subfamily